ncbi:hypothetical protein CF326_g9970, partial [Tilletia indica]
MAEHHEITHQDSRSIKTPLLARPALRLTSLDWPEPPWSSLKHVHTSLKLSWSCTTILSPSMLGPSRPQDCPLSTLYSLLTAIMG